MTSKSSNIRFFDKYDVQQKILSFAQRSLNMEKVQKEVDNGWGVVNLVYHQENYVVILEKLNTKDTVYIPARKNIRIKK